MANLPEEEYTYCCACVRAWEAKMPGRAVIEAMAAAPGSGDVIRILRECGYRESGTRDAGLTAMLARAFDETTAVLPDPGTLEPLRYPYDANNAKVALKARLRGGDREELYSPIGSVPAAKIREAAVSSDFSCLPPAMAAAATEAASAAAKTHDPRRIDLLLDRACYASMLAGLAGEDTILSWIKEKIDLTNILTAFRIVRLGLGAEGRVLLEDAAPSGGFLPIDRLGEALPGGESALADTLRYGRYSALAEKIDAKGTTHAEVERTCDDLFTETIRQARFSPFGACVPAAYLLGYETAIRNIRILCAGKDAHLSDTDLRARLRESYV